MNKKYNENINWAKKELSNFGVKDGRIMNRTSNVLETLAENPELSIPNACASAAKTKATYRLINNDNWHATMLLKSHQMQTVKRSKDESIVLAVQDTTEISLENLKATKGLGPHNIYKKSLGILMHSVLALNTEGVPLGILESNTWSRDINNYGNSNKCSSFPIEEKESYKWLSGMDSASKCFSNKKVVHICDREADITEFLIKAHKENKDFVIRARHDRVLCNDKYKKLFERIEAMDILGQTSVILPRDSKSKTEERTVTLSIKSDNVELFVLDKFNKLYGVNTLPISVVIAEETGKGKDKIKWILLTNQDINGLDDAIEKINWYKHRWKVERFHYALKSGCKIEDLQLESFENFVKAIAIYSIVAWRLLWLLYSGREAQQLPATVAFEDIEIGILKKLAKKTKTPISEIMTIREAILLVSKMGGFLGRKGDGDPGVKVLWQGITKLSVLVEFQDLLIP